MTMGSLDQVQFLFKHYNMNAFCPLQKQNSDFQYLAFPIGYIGVSRVVVGPEDLLQYCFKGHICSRQVKWNTF